MIKCVVGLRLGRFSLGILCNRLGFFTSQIDFVNAGMNAFGKLLIVHKHVQFGLIVEFDSQLASLLLYFLLKFVRTQSNVGIFLSYQQDKSQIRSQFFQPLIERTCKNFLTFFFISFLCFFRRLSYSSLSASSSLSHFCATFSKYLTESPSFMTLLFDSSSFLTKNEKALRLK